MSGRTLKARYRVDRMVSDMTRRGWNVMDLARESGLSHMTIRRFFDGIARTPKTAKKIALALERPIERYFAGVAA